MSNVLLESLLSFSLTCGDRRWAPTSRHAALSVMKRLIGKDEPGLADSPFFFLLNTFVERCNH